MNLCSLAVSLFLAFSLTSKFTTDESLTATEKYSRTVTYNVVLISIISFSLLSSFAGKFLSNKIFMSINRKLHDKVTKSVLSANISFFEENTQGRILNRFSKDVSTLDNLVFTVLEMADVSFQPKSHFFFHFLLVYREGGNHFVHGRFSEPMAFDRGYCQHMLLDSHPSTMSDSHA